MYIMITSMFVDEYVNNFIQSSLLGMVLNLLIGRCQLNPFKLGHLTRLTTHIQSWSTFSFLSLIFKFLTKSRINFSEINKWQCISSKKYIIHCSKQLMVVFQNCNYNNLYMENLKNIKFFRSFILMIVTQKLIVCLTPINS